MKRLIDADELMKDIIKRFGCKPYIEVGNKCEYVHDIIDEQPTAYDIDKVVEELEEDITDNVDCETGEPCDNWVVDMQNELTSKHINIVRKGGAQSE